MFIYLYHHIFKILTLFPTTYEHYTQTKQKIKKFEETKIKIKRTPNYLMFDCVGLCIYIVSRSLQKF